jgi:hypothetical protein
MVHVNDEAFINEKTIARHEVLKLKISYSAPNAVQKKKIAHPTFAIRLPT